MRLTLMHPNRRTGVLGSPCWMAKTAGGRGRNAGTSFRDAKQAANSDNPALKGQLSAVLRDQLMNQLGEINSLESATIWARHILPAKNSLCAADAHQVEHAFGIRLAELNGCESEPEGPLPSSTSRLKSASSHQRQRLKSIRTSVAESVDKSQLSHPEPRRLRDRAHVRFVAKQACLICGAFPQTRIICALSSGRHLVGR
jgi:hypothetical protein